MPSGDIVREVVLRIDDGTSNNLDDHEAILSGRKLREVLALDVG